MSISPYTLIFSCNMCRLPRKESKPLMTDSLMKFSQAALSHTHLIHIPLLPSARHLNHRLPTTAHV